MEFFIYDRLMIQLTDTPVHVLHVDGHDVFVKRDDLLHPAFSGNKARKFAYFLEQDFPSIDTLVGYGSPQANSLYSMSALAKLKGWQLQFYVDHIASHLLNNPLGNYRAALQNGAKIIDLSQCLDRGQHDCADYIEQCVLPGRDELLFIPEGGRCHYAEPGVRQLAREIIAWKQAEQLSQLTVFLPSGTGTTALFLQKSFTELDDSIQVMTCSAVGGDDYLKLQWRMLASDESMFPQILSPNKRYHFGKLYPEFFQVWQKLKQAGMEFELLYDPLGWLVLLHFLANKPMAKVLYVHQGGILGNESMLPRYRRKYGG
ncbi:1-aminocyclopropane-1-carboxylate deaminase [Shewanella algidipiscicola]|uniref:1-aminocyclopropane-1-carboxylate deaminase n=2 Tax=Shewanella algidipiscicola TaxID=614070 RepID=A0ABQ4PLW8_9GAMM|nr:1-aminocyclopropane-1-carboxylate deaminase [Shewanella algidipiscicola]